MSEQRAKGLLALAACLVIGVCLVVEFIAAAHGSP